MSRWVLVLRPQDAMPPGFSWVEPRSIAALAFPHDADDLKWLRRQGIDVLVSLAEEPPPRHWVNDAGLMLVHVPVADMDAPTDRQLDHVVGTLERATAAGMAAAVHCTAGKGRTGTALAAYFVSRGMAASAAIDKVRGLRPGSVETAEQERAIERYAARRDGR